MRIHINIWACFLAIKSLYRIDYHKEENFGGGNFGEFGDLL